MLDFVSRICMNISEDMGMAENELFIKRVGNVCYIKQSFLVSDFRIEENVKQNVAELFADIRTIIVDECVAKFVDFFNGVGTQ
ncbi:unknown [Prevotella sp. CAG:1031]|nr:unknown [Prevotella sp. CAG:1031]